MSDVSGGLDPAQLEHLVGVIESDVAAERYHGAVVAVARHGEVGLLKAIGSAYAGGENPLSLDSVFSIFSVTKAITNVLVFRAIERGQFALTTRVSEIIPEFKGGLREQITIYHLLTHSSGLPSVYTPKAGMYLDRLADIIAAICENVHSATVPGERVDYAPMAHHALMGEAVRRTDPRGRSYREIADQDLLNPLKLASTSIGLRPDLKPRHVRPDFRGNSPMAHLGSSNLGPNGAFLEPEAEMPWVGCSSTTPDLLRFAEMLRRGGELDGARIVSPTILKRARVNQTGEKPNELYKALAHRRGWEPFPAYIGLGFSLRGPSICHHLFGTLTSPETFGNYGAGSALFWVDPELDLTFVCLSAGVMNSADNFERFQKLSDIAVSAAIRLRRDLANGRDSDQRRLSRAGRRQRRLRRGQPTFGRRLAQRLLGRGGTAGYQLAHPCAVGGRQPVVRSEIWLGSENGAAAVARRPPDHAAARQGAGRLQLDQRHGL